MARKRKIQKNKEKHLKVNPDLEGFEIGIDKFGEIHSSLKIDQLNEFLNKNLADKKLKNKPQKSGGDKKDKK